MMAIAGGHPLIAILVRGEPLVLSQLLSPYTPFPFTPIQSRDGARTRLSLSCYRQIQYMIPFLVVRGRREPRVPDSIPGAETWQEDQVHYLLTQQRENGDRRRKGVEWG